MGLLDRLFGRTDDEAPPRRNLSGRSIGFAAQRIDPGVRPDRRSLAKRKTNEAECWAAYKAIGEIGYVVDLFGNALRRIRIFPAGIDDPEEGRIPLGDVSWSGPSMVAIASAELDRIRSVEHGQGEVLSQMAVNLKVAGAGNLYGRLDPDTGEEDWEVISSSALDVKRDQWGRDQWVVRRYPSDRDGTPVGIGDFLWRFWQRDPEWPGLAYSEMRRVLSHASGLQILEQGARARGRSRLAGNGMLVISNQVAFKAGGQQGQGADFMEDLMDYMAAPIAEEGSASSFVPMLVDLDTDDVNKAMAHITFDRPLTEIEENREDKLLRRIAQGLDAPPELVTGMADLNHWTAWQIEESTYEAHVEPLALRIADILAVAVLRPALLAAGFPLEVVARVQVGLDPSDLIRRPGRGDDANDGHDRLVLSDETWRREKGFADEDAPPMDELLRRMALKRGITTEMLTAELLSNYAGADVARTIAKGDAQTAETARGSERVTETTATEPAAIAPPAEPGPPALPPVVASAVPSRLGSILHAIDVDLMARLEGAASGAVERALERASSRAMRATRGKRISLAGGGRGLLGRLGADVTLGIGEEEMVTEADFDPLAADWARWIPAAWASAVGVLGVDVDEPSDDFDAGWLLLLAALVGVARAALGDPGIPTVEADPTVVQPGHIRRALARAGGANGALSDGGAVLLDAGTRPAGMVATGETILEAAANAGLILAGWTWRTGFPRLPFPPHHALDGIAFSSWTADVLANESGQWPGVGHWFPGDHINCHCSGEIRLEIVGEN